MWLAKHTVMSAAGILGGVFGYVSAPTEVLAFCAAFGCMLACASVADFLTAQWEEEEDDDDTREAV
jgi:hypothetical protein